MGAGNADAGKLPGGSFSKSLPGGGKVSIRLFNESVRVTNSVANNHFSREVFVSGTARVLTSGGIKGGQVTVGYLVGCQLTFGASSSTKGGVTTDSAKQFATPEITLPNGVTVPPIETPLAKSSGTSAGVTIGPGQAVFQPVVRLKIDDTVVNSFNFTGARGGVVYSQERFGVDGCAGFAQARALVNVKVSTDEFKGNVTLYGKPFSIG
ncbi:MspA family porin [Gordonia iterans]|uniref:MspA family porin n=1 Tax=Gordonia iterans TaxID=1004901 RepID=UPI0022782141|nr:MspA family porin [Gordonia iterans]